MEDLATVHHMVPPGELGENITTAGIDLVDLPVGTLLHLGERAQVRLTGLRNPCWQVEDFQSRLLKMVITVVLPQRPYVTLTRV